MNSTGHAAGLGDEAWRHLLAAHAAVRRELDRFDGPGAVVSQRQPVAGQLEIPRRQGRPAAGARTRARQQRVALG